MQQYPPWKTLTLVLVALFGFLYALPNIYGEAPSVQIATVSGDPVPADLGAEVSKALDADKIIVSLRQDPLGRACIRVAPHFYNSEAELARVVDWL